MPDSQSGHEPVSSTNRPIRLLLATLNPGKRRELAALLQGLPFEILQLGDLDPIPECVEDGTTFRENAVKKALHYASLSGLPAFSDDSGLEVEALGGRPGVYSARFAGDGASDADRVRKILIMMEGIPEARRQARFVCTVAFCADGVATDVFEGTADGAIALEPAGTNGFGYDPIFLFPSLGRTFAQLSPEEKSRISHRGKALQQFRRFLIERYLPAGRSQL